MKMVMIKRSGRKVILTDEAAAALESRNLGKVTGSVQVARKPKRSPKIFAALRVRNEARWIREVLDSVKWCEAIYLMDDHSEDNTAAIARDCGAVVLESPFDGLDEARDKEWLVQRIAQDCRPGAWILMIDGDEILEEKGRDKIVGSITRNSGALSFRLQIRYLWNSRDRIRVDGVYGRFSRPSLFMLNGCYSFMRSGKKGNLHTSCAPLMSHRACGHSPAMLWHLGYMNREDRIRKWRYYNSLDPVNYREGYDARHPERGSYPHMVQGDIPEVPAGCLLMHSGPLEIRGIGDDYGAD